LTFSYFWILSGFMLLFYVLHHLTLGILQPVIDGSSPIIPESEASRLSDNLMIVNDLSACHLKKRDVARSLFFDLVERFNYHDYTDSVLVILNRVLAYSLGNIFLRYRVRLINNQRLDLEKHRIYLWYTSPENKNCRLKVQLHSRVEPLL